ncbi:LytTR family DNA-binding domain-containing protein [Flavitalea sp. BT771]|uniref:LytR/AlgR family response regulator transcription factor n=1 Tax=Flavitalea sp. BT771 TaxID=3063329 RepID=UPI0026E163EE|nr:LytTR family DNA-binding domain-containing protein [Flavitalea sp. BT771]MDO6435165.1 LytTR family DNA-binding domain-containing protein [Flavitalea sp. BT771]MDV6224130.1 LytTR family DNA-binding domain-containing protein [Flavitalea sp. BT771]
MSINTVIIEDEEKSAHVLQQLIKEYAAECNICGTAGHVSNAVRLIEDVRPQVVFIDIRIADGTGFDVLHKLSSHQFELVFVTAYDSYALEAIKHSAIDYLLKPIGVVEFETTVERLRKRLAEKVQYNTVETLLKKLVQQGGQEKIAIPMASGFDFIHLEDILWCKSDGMYTTFYLSNKSKVISSRNLGTFEHQLAQNNFFRIHHSIMINMRWVTQYVKGKGGSVVLADGMKLQVSQRRKAEFMDRFLPNAG